MEYTPVGHWWEILFLDLPKPNLKAFEASILRLSGSVYQMGKFFLRTSGGSYGKSADFKSFKRAVYPGNLRYSPLPLAKILIIC